MRIKRAVSLLVVLALTVLMFGTMAVAEDEKVVIDMLWGKAEIITQIEAMIKEYNETFPDVQINDVPVSGQTLLERLTALYASGNAPTFYITGQEFQNFQDKVVDLSDQPWVSNVMPSTLEYVTRDGKVYGMPLNVEAYALIYNEEVLNEAVGGQFDPGTVKTQADLEALFQKIEAIGKKAISISPLDWSLGAHFTNPLFTTQSEEASGRYAFLDSMKAGEVDLASNAIFNGWVDTFDLMMKYNNHASSPLSPQYEDGALELAMGDVGFWFMGNWAYPQLSEFAPEGTFKFLPLVLSNDAATYGNSQISVDAPSYWVIDGSQSTEAQQQKAKEFLNWLVSSERGQYYYIDQFQFIPPFTNFDRRPEDAMSNNVMDYIASGDTLQWMNTYYPAEVFPRMGASLQKYLDGKLDRAGLASSIQADWTN